MVWAGKEALGKASCILSPKLGSWMRNRLTLVHICGALGSDEEGC